MSEKQEKTDDAFVAAVKKLGAGYRRRRAMPRCSIREPDDESADSAPAPAARYMDGASALSTGYKYRRPVPPPDDDDLVGQDANRDSAVPELGTGLAAAANGTPHKGGDGGDRDGGDSGHGGHGGHGGDGADGGDGGDGDGVEDGDDDDLFTAHSSSASSIATDEVVAFAMDWDDEDGRGGQQEKAEELASSSDPAKFQGAREASRSLLTAAAFFARTADDMLKEHKRAREEADLYMSEVNIAKRKLGITNMSSSFNMPPSSTGD